MKTINSSRHLAFTSTFIVAFTLFSASLKATEFTLDEAQSQISLSGSVANNTLKEQGAGSLSTTFFGKINADITAAGIQFTGGSTLTARTNGVWKPGPKGGSGTAPAAYAAQASTILGTIQGALRDLVLDLTSSTLPITGGQFDASALQFGFPSNSIASFDYDAGFLGKNGIALSGISTNKIVNGATLSGAAGARTLTIQVDTEFHFKALSDNDSTVHLIGKLIATEAAGSAAPSFGSIKIINGKVVMTVSDGGTAPRLESSSDLNAWSSRTPEQTSNGADVTLTLPVGGAQEFYRIAK